jgi:hypothetical protein
MANVKITDLTAIAGVDLASNDVLPIVDINVDQTKKVAISDLQIGVSDANDFVTYTRLQANIDLVQDNVASVTVGTAADTETRLNANLDIVQDNVSAQNSYITTNFTTLQLTDSVQDNVTSAESNVVAVESRLNANLDIVQDNVTAQNSYITTNFTTLQLTDSVQDNVTSAESNVADVETRRSDNTFFTYNTGSNVVIDTANVEPSQNNLFSLGAPDKVWADVYIGPGSLKLGEVTISALAGEGITITGASGDQANVTTPSLGGVSNISAELAAIDARIVANTGVAASNDFVTYTLLDANISIVQDNVASAESNVNLVRSNLDAFASSANSNAAALASDIATLSTVDTATGTETRLNANLDITNDNVSSLTTTVDNFGTSSNANAAALALEDTALQARLATNVTAFTNEDTALQSRLTSNVNTLITNINTLDANADAIEARRAANLVSAVFTSDVTVSGNLIVTGAQVDLGVQTATIQNNFIELSAELNPGDAPATDSGLLINRGNKGNVFIGDHLGEDGIIFVRTQTPDTNTIVAIESFMDLHANALHVASPVNLNRVHFGLRASEDNGIIIDDSGANINFVAGGSYVANVHYDGTLNSQNAIIAPAVFAGGVELQANDSATLFSARANDFATYTHITANVDIVQDNVAQNATDISAVETRRTANIAGAVSTITTGNLTTSRALASDGSGKVAVSDVTATELGYLDGVTSAIQTQLDSKSSTANASALAAEDVALQSRLSTNVTTFTNEDTALQARITANASTAASNDFITYTRLNANIDVVSSNAAAVETRRVANIAGAVSTITTGNLTASRALASDGSGKVAASDVTSTELGYLDGVTSAIQTQLDAKQATITGAATTIDDTNLTASRALVSDGSGKVSVSAITSTELAFLDGLDQNLNSNLESLAAGIAATSAAGFPTGDYGLLDAANAATDAFGFAVADLTIFDMSDTPAGELDAQDLGALT